MKIALKALPAMLLLCISLLAAPRAEAVIIDLTSKRTVGLQTQYGIAQFSTDFTQSTGTGNFNTFLRVQADGREQGYNTSAPNVFDNKSGAHTKDIRLKDLVRIGDYYSFVIDVNESNSGNPKDVPITLNALKIFTSSTGGQNTTNVESLGVKRFDLDMDANGNFVDNEVRYTDANSGSGQADIAILIPVYAFAGVSPDAFVIFYAQFGVDSDPTFNGVTNGGFEEVNTAKGIIVNVPEPTSILPLAGVLGAVLGSHRLRRRRR